MKEPSPNDRPQAEAAARHNLRFEGAEGRPMLLCHGFGMDQTLWRNLVPRFRGNHRVILMDHVGSGGSDLGAYRLETYASIDGYVKDVLDLCRVLDLRDLVFVGHSVSAMVGLLAAQRAPERFACLIMVGASPRYLDDAGYRGGFSREDVEELLAGFDVNRQAWTEQMAKVATGNPDHPEWAEEVAARFMSADPVVLRQFARTTFGVDARSALAACRTPTLLLQSREDPIVPVEVSEYLKGAIPGAVLRYLNASGHFPQMSSPGELGDAIAAFVEGLGPRRGED